MAATGKTPILLYGSATPTNAPVAGNLTNSSDGCEIAINVADKNLFFKDSTNAINTVPIRQSSGSSNGWLSSTDWTTFNGKQAALGYTPVNKAGDTMTGALTATTFTSSSAVPTFILDETGGTSAYRQLWMLTYTDVVSWQSRSSAGAYLSTDYAMNKGVSGATQHQWNISNNAAFTINSSANAVVNTGNLVIGTSGKGIDFSATAGTGTSELLADYEEGTWTPTYALTTPGTSSFTYNIQSAYYTKVGNLVYARCAIRSNSFTQGTGSGTVRIAGLPYAAKASSNFGGATVNYTSSFAGDMPSSGTCYQGTSYVDLYYRTTSNGGTISLDVTDLGTGASANYTILTIEYLTD